MLLVLSAVRINCLVSKGYPIHPKFTNAFSQQRCISVPSTLTGITRLLGCLLLMILVVSLQLSNSCDSVCHPQMRWPNTRGLFPTCQFAFSKDWGC